MTNLLFRDDIRNQGRVRGHDHGHSDGEDEEGKGEEGERGGDGHDKQTHWRRKEKKPSINHDNETERAF